MKKLTVFWKIVIATILAMAIAYAIVDSLTVKIPIFGFHSVIDRENIDKLPSRASYLDYTKQDLAKLLDYLMQNNYWFLSTQDFYDYFLVENRKIPPEYLGRKPVMLTFDDGYININAYLMPILKNLQNKYNKNIEVVLFVNPKFMEKKQTNKVQYLQCKDLLEGINQNFYDVQSHGFSHADLTKLDTKTLQFELRESQKYLKDCTAKLEDNKTIAEHFAYPYNRVNPQVREYTSKYYRSAYLYNDRIHKLGLGKNNYKISRIGVLREDSPEKLISIAQTASFIKRDNLKQ